MTTRIKSVFGNSQEVAHVWSNFTGYNDTRNVRNRTGNIYTSGASIYSYGSHFPIACHHWDEEGNHTVLLTTRSYSSTTAGHICDVRRALPSYRKVIYCYNPTARDSSAHEANLRDMMDTILDLQEKYSKARSLKTEYAGRIETTLANAKAYCDLFSLPHSFTDVESFIAAQREVIARESAKREAQLERDREELESALATALPIFAKQREMWMSGLEVDYRIFDDLAPRSLRRYFDRYSWARNSDTALRLCPTDSSVVQTSHGASFPARHCERIYKFWRSLVTSGETYNRETGKEFPRIGDFQIDNIDLAGNIVAGCHTITPEEIERFASVLGISSLIPEASNV